MQLLSRDIRVFLAATVEGPAGSNQQHQQQLLLPHPQLVVFVLALAALRYKQLYKQLLRLKQEGVVAPDEASDMFENTWSLAAYFAPLAGAAAGAAAGAGPGAALGTTPATAAGAGTAAGAAGPAESSAGVAPAAEVADSNTCSSALHQLLQALGNLATAAGSHNLHFQHQQGQPQVEQQQDEHHQQQKLQQQLPPAWVILLQGNGLKALLPALFRAAGELNAAAAAVASHLQQWQQSATADASQLRDVQQRIQSALTALQATSQQLGHPSLSQKRRCRLQEQARQHKQEWSKLYDLAQELEQKLMPAPKPLLAGLAKSLHVVGTLLSSLPSRFHCNNFDCTNLGIVSEGFALVRGSSCVCGGCVAGLATSEAAAKEVAAARWVVGDGGCMYIGAILDV
jgi:signal transduction histidine kinase